MTVVPDGGKWRDMPHPELDPDKLTDDEVLLVSKDLQRALQENEEIQEMLRMANAQTKPAHRILTLRATIKRVLKDNGDELRKLGAA